MLMVNNIVLYGGYSFLRSRPLKTFIRKRRARAIRKINEYNERRRKV